MPDTTDPIEYPTDDAPLQRAEPESSGADLLEKIDDLLVTERFEWARETLEGIANTISEKGYATDRQRRAVENIEAGERQHGRRGW